MEALSLCQTPQLFQCTLTNNVYVFSRKPSKLSRGIDLIFNFSPALFPEHYCISHLVWLGFLKLRKQFDVLGSRREWLHSPSYINLLKEYKGYITIASPMSYKAFHANNSYHFYSDLSLPLVPRLRKAESGTLPRVPFISTVQILNFFDTGPSLSIWHFAEWFPTDFVSSLPENPYHIQIPAVDVIGLKVGWSWQKECSQHCRQLLRNRAGILAPMPLLFPLYYLWHLVKNHHFFFNDSLEIRILFYNRIILLESMYFIHCIPFLDMILL